ncbi:hypothetical protein RHMOL_Rhmol08G0183900 [Rhododendron molle]|uniref:Uncharacterized protein n=1 Tax=Rhododendron molle TaxID=49168 RepID=A0ACC0MPP8_RHOML|nr:hypothetical protein RHMOL_Rhmol08G0183900 [Rhododendron molle]
MVEHDNGGGGREVVDRPEDAEGPMEVEIEDQTVATVAMGQGVMIEGSGDGRGDREQEVGGEVVQRTPESEPRVSKEVRAVGPSAEPMASGTMARASIVVDGSSGSAEGNGASGGDIRPTASPPKDSARGKGVVTGEEETTEVPVEHRKEDVLFWPAEGSSSHRPVTKHYIAEFLSDEALVRLLEENPALGSQS